MKGAQEAGSVRRRNVRVALLLLVFFVLAVTLILRYLIRRGELG